MQVALNCTTCCCSHNCPVHLTMNLGIDLTVSLLVCRHAPTIGMINRHLHLT